MAPRESTLSAPVDATAGIGVAETVGELFRQLAGGPLPVRLSAWDGSETGPADAPEVVLASPRALRRLLWSPGELGLAQAYVTGEIDVRSDIAEGLRRVWSAFEAGGGPRRTAGLGLGGRLRALSAAARLGALGPRLAPPASQARLRGRLHTVGRDRAAIAHHYDLSNEFYALLLDPSMAYSCAYWTSDRPGYGLDDAQRDKLDLICRKLDLTPGQRFLDVGCGWGSLLLYAAEHYGVHAVGVTLSEQQANFVRARIARKGLADRVEVRLQHYRDIVGSESFDAAATIEMGEHVGADAYPGFAARLHELLVPGGRLLVQQMSHAANAPGGGAFIETFIAPDMHMRPLGETVGLWEAAGFEVRGVEALREHYVRTVRAWLDRFESRLDEVVALVGVEVARVWRLYLAGGALAFEDGRMGVDQILAVRPPGRGRRSGERSAGLQTGLPAATAAGARRGG